MRLVKSLVKSLANSLMIAAAVVLLLAPHLFASPANAQTYPARNVTLVVPFPPGGGTDIGARVIAQKLSERWGQTVIVENKPGAAGNIGVDFASKAAPDGYTILMGNIGTTAINPSLYANLPYNPDKAFAPITLVAELPLALVATTGLPANTLAELFTAAKATPGEMTYGSSGAGGSPHLAAALMESDAGLKLVHVPYKGGGPMMQDVIGGHIRIAFATVLEASGHIKSGKVKALAVSSIKRSVSLPDVPTIAEAGIPGFNSISWIGLLAPAGTPDAIVSKIADDVRAILAVPDVRERLTAQGAVPVGSTPAEFTALIATDRARYAKIIAEKGIKAD
jgi:tripartite-type tricarboxylate transporter receptor subunit TctC